jgi:hypothetical protein
MFESVHLSVHERNNALLSRLSRSMKHEVSWYINRTWLSKVWYLTDHDGSKRAILIRLASKLHAVVYPPGEVAPPGFMCTCHTQSSPQLEALPL